MEKLEVGFLHRCHNNDQERYHRVVKLVRGLHHRSLEVVEFMMEL